MMLLLLMTLQSQRQLLTVSQRVLLARPCRLRRRHYKVEDISLTPMPCRSDQSDLAITNADGPDRLLQYHVKNASTLQSEPSCITVRER